MSLRERDDPSLFARVQEQNLLRPYYTALQAADRHWAEGQFDVDDLARYLERILRDQLSDV